MKKIIKYIVVGWAYAFMISLYTIFVFRISMGAGRLTTTELVGAFVPPVGAVIVFNRIITAMPRSDY